DVGIAFLDKPVEVDINEAESRRGAPVPKQPRLDMFGPQWLPQESIVLKVDLPDGKIVGGLPVPLHEVQLLGRERRRPSSGGSLVSPRTRRPFRVARCRAGDAGIEMVSAASSHAPLLLLLCPDETHSGGYVLSRAPGRV